MNIKKLQFLVRNVPRIPVIESKTMLADITKAIANLEVVFFDNNLPYLKGTHYYQYITEEDLKNLIPLLLQPEKLHYMSSNQIVECAKRLQTLPQLQLDLSDYFWERQYQLNLLNGVYDISTKKLTEHKEDDRFNYILNFRYKPGCKLDDAPIFKKFIETSLDMESLDCLLRSLAYCLSSLTKGRACIVLLGKGRTGKSTILDLLESAVSPDMISYEAFHTMASQQSKAKYIGKRINISRDNSNVPMKHEDSFKSLISCEQTTCRNLYENSKDFLPTLKFIFASNCELNFAHLDDAVLDRLVIIPFEKTVPDEVRDPDLKEKLLKEKDVIFSMAIDTLKDLVESRYDFRMPEAGKAYINLHRRQLHSIEEFLQEETVLSATGSVSSAELNRVYDAWCRSNNIEPLGRNVFYKHLKEYNQDIEYCKVFFAGSRVNGFKGIALRRFTEKGVVSDDMSGQSLQSSGSTTAGAE